MTGKVLLLDAAKELGCSSQAVREHMKQKLLDLGSVIPPEKTGKKQWKYHIYPYKLNKHFGRNEI